MNLIEFASHYNQILKASIDSHKKGSVSYFSPKIQNEIIELLGNKVSKVTIEKIKLAKYFSILFDCTSDVSRKEQMSQIIRFVHVDENKKVTVEESFIDFIESHEKPGLGLATEILQKLEQDNLNIEDVRGQGYDNGANMSGKYLGVQSRILKINKYATYIPCEAHSLNLVGNNAASVTPEMLTFFGIIQILYTFFSSSTSRWERLMEKLKLTSKRICDTRWSARSSAVKALCSHFAEVFEELKEYSSDLSNSDAMATAKGLLVQINFQFICTLLIWNKILHNINVINKALQSKDMTLEKSMKLLDGLCTSLQKMRDEGFNSEIQDSEKIAECVGIEASFSGKRNRKKKRMDIDS